MAVASKNININIGLAMLKGLKLGTESVRALFSFSTRNVSKKICSVNASQCKPRPMQTQIEKKSSKEAIEKKFIIISEVVLPTVF